MKNTHLDPQTIVKNIIDGKITRKNDEKYAGGYWDLALQLGDNLDQTEKIYNALWKITETLLI